MDKRFVIMCVTALIVLPLTMVGCKAKTEIPAEEMKTEETATTGTSVMTDDTRVTEITEPSQTVATETIPPTAAAPIAEKTVVITPAPVAENLDRTRQIQTALKAAGFYAGTVDGKIGPKTKQAIVNFQKAKGLTADGKVGPKTWNELSKYLSQ